MTKQRCVLFLRNTTLTAAFTVGHNPNIQREKRMAGQVVHVNLMGTVRVLEMARTYQLKRIIYMSSVSVYGAQAIETNHLVEKSSHDTVTLYEINKYAAGRICQRYFELFALPVVIARIGHVFGPWEHGKGLRDTMNAPFQALHLATKGEKAVLSRARVRDGFIAEMLQVL